MIDSYTGKKITKAMGSIWPAPVVEMHFTSGRRMRYSFWAPSKAGPQELVERGILAGCLLARTIGTDPNDAYNCWVYPNERIFRLYVEDKSRAGPWHAWQGDEIDPWAPPVAVKQARKPAVRKADWQDALRELLKVAELNGSCPHERYTEAREVAQRLIAA